MKTITFNQKNSVSGQPTVILNSITIDAEKALTATSTKSIYLRIGFMNKTPFISQRGNGTNGAGDIISLNINENVTIDLQNNVFDCVNLWAEKNNLIIK